MIARALIALIGLVVLVAPVAEAVAQDEGRLVVVLDPTGSKSKKIRGEFRRVLEDHPHIVYSQSEFIDAGNRQGVSDDRFWDNPDIMAHVASAEGIDAVVAGDMQRRGKRYILSVFVFEGRSGEIVGEFEVNLGKKPKLKSSKRRSIGEQAHAFIVNTGGDAGPGGNVTIVIETDPPGARVMRDNEYLGQTPATIEVPASGQEEVWELVYKNQPAGMVRVDLSGDQNYSLPLALDGEVEVPDDTSSGGGFDGPTGGGLPVLEVDIGADITQRSLTVTTSRPDVGLNYSSSAYPVIRFGADFFPFPLFSKSDYLAGLGFSAYGGFGSLESKIPVDSERLPPDNTDCALSDVAGVIDCPTEHTEFGIGATYRLLLDDAADGGLDPDGMVLALWAGYTWLVFDVGANPTYEGHGYQGLDVHGAFGTPLGLDELRLDAKLGFTTVFTFGDADMIANWGQGATAYGIGGMLQVSYEIFAGLFVEAGYRGRFLFTTYELAGCQGPTATVVDASVPNCGCGFCPEGSEASDQFHQGLLGIGYRLH